MLAIDRTERGRRRQRGAIYLSLCLAIGGCSSAPSVSVRETLKAHRALERPRHEHARPTETLSGYITFAATRNATLMAAYRRLQATTLRANAAGTPDDPTLSIGVFVRAVETRVGPQRARLGIQQRLPWPSRFGYEQTAASEAAAALASRLEGAILDVRAAVGEIYFRLWAVRETKAIHEHHLSVLTALSETVRARVSTGATGLADQQQVDLKAAQLEDMLNGMDEEILTIEAELRAVLGMRDQGPLATADAPPPAHIPAESIEALREAALAHPYVDAHRRNAAAHRAAASAQGTKALPSFTVGADWIITDEARMDGVDDSGKDAVAVSLGMSVPLYQGAYDAAAKAEQAEARAAEADADAARDRLAYLVTKHLSDVRDAARRVGLYEHTLVPQAESAYSSVLGAYVSGKGTVAQILMAEQTLLALKVELVTARARHASRWASLEQVVGRPVQAGVDGPADNEGSIEAGRIPPTVERATPQGHRAARANDKEETQHE